LFSRAVLLSQSIPLSDVPVSGGRWRLARVVGGERLRRRLLALGLNIGGEVEVIQRRGGGVVLACGGNRVAVGAGVAARVYVEEVR
jgi:ferrous iron transport protein A